MATSSRRIKIPHPDLALSQKAILNADVASGSSLTVLTTTGFVDQNIAVIGEPGEEDTESLPIQAHTNTTFTLTGNVLAAHNKSTPVYRSEVDQVEISYSTASVWTVLVTTNIQWDQVHTVYTHIGGLDSYSYRFRYKNSYSGNYSEYSGSVAGSGYAKNQIGYLVSNVRLLIKDPQRKIVSDSEIMRFLTRAKDIIRGTRNDWWFWRKEDTGTITTVASTRTYNLDTISTQIDYIKDIRLNYNNGSINEMYTLDDLTDIEFDYRIRDITSATNFDYIRVYNITPPDSSSTSGYIRVDPKPLTTGYGSFYVRYYINETDYSSVADTTSIPIPSILEDYAIAQCERIKGDENRALLYERLFFGPSPDERDNKSLSGIALLQQMQSGKGRPIGKPQQMKVWKGRNVMNRFTLSRGSNIDLIRENYF